MNGYPPPAMPPASAWQEVKNKADGKIYYHNKVTNATSWEKPEELKDEVERAVAGTGWSILFDTNSNKRYYHNKNTKETTWAVPVDIQKIVDETKLDQPPQRPPSVAGPPGWGAAPPHHPPSFDNRRLDRDDYQSDRRDRDRDRDRERDFGSDRLNINFALGNELQFSSPQEAEAAFMKVLKQMRAQPDWDWQQAVRAGIKDPNWRAIPDPEKREEAFKKYCEDLRTQEKLKEQDRQAKLRSDFTAMLRSHPEIKHYTRWKTALPIIEEETIFRSAKDDVERRVLFEEYITTLKKANEEQEVEDRRSALDEVMVLLQALDLEPFTRWQAAEAELEKSSEFHDGKLKALNRVDVLNQFEKHVRQLQREYNNRVQADRAKKHRIERKNRDAFRNLLNELRENGALKAGTKWKEIHDKIKDDPRYIAMLGQAGSSPLDLFWDALEEEEGKFRTLRRYALDVLEQQRFEVTTATPVEEFLSVMRTDPRTTGIDEQSMHSIFDYIMTKVKRRAEDDRRDEELNERYAMDNLRSAIKRLEPPISLLDTWELVRPRIETTEEYRAVNSDALRESVFDKHLRRLKERENDRRDRGRRDERDRERDRDRRDRDREYRNGHPDSHRRHRTRTRSPEHDPYAAERRRAQQDREARYRNNDSTGLSPPPRRERRDDDRYERSRRSPAGDHYGRERREREVERERSYVSRADPRETSVSALDYGDGAGRTASSRRRRESDESTSKRDSKRARYSPRLDRKSKTPVTELPKEEDRAVRSGSEEGEIEED